MIDPPWRMQKGGRRRYRPLQGPEFGYQTMTVAEIFELLDAVIFSRAYTTHVVFIWANDRYLASCETGMGQRGYKRHARFIWDKQNGVAPAFTVRFSHEYLLWFYKPKLLPVATAYRGKYTTVLVERSREHSRKPDTAYTMIENLYPNARKMDVFSREKRTDWQQFGDQVNFFN